MLKLTQLARRTMEGPNHRIYVLVMQDAGNTGVD